MILTAGVALPAAGCRLGTPPLPGLPLCPHGPLRPGLRPFGRVRAPGTALARLGICGPSGFFVVDGLGSLYSALGPALLPGPALAAPAQGTCGPHRGPDRPGPACPGAGRPDFGGTGAGLCHGRAARLRGASALVRPLGHARVAGGRDRRGCRPGPVAGPAPLARAGALLRPARKACAAPRPPLCRSALWPHCCCPRPRVLPPLWDLGGTGRKRSWSCWG